MKDVTGVERGKCNSCECPEYRTRAGSGSLRCDYCNHTPAEHAKVTQLGACQKCGRDTCDKYVPEDGESTGECQYCGCDANSHAGAAAALNNSRQPIPPGGGSVPSPPQAGIQTRMTGGQPTQSYALGTCLFPGCPYPKCVEGDYMHDYCSRTCARKHAALGAQGTQNTPKPPQGFTANNPGSESPQPAPATGGGRVLVQAQQRTVLLQRPGEPPRAATITMVRATRLPGEGRGPLPSGQVCKKCNLRPANPGYSWCQECHTSS